MLPDQFTTLPDLIAMNAARRPAHAAIIAGDDSIDWAGFDARATRVAASLARDGLAKGEVVAISAAMSIDYIAVWIGALRAGLAVAPLSTTLAPEARAAMIRDSGAAMVFDDDTLRDLDGWLAPRGASAPVVTIAPTDAFNLIYSSGTTGKPKGIVQPHSMRWSHIQRGLAQGYDADSVTLVSTPLYSNTTLVSVFPTLGLGGTLVLMSKFDVGRFLELSQQHRVTHAMLVPVQYARIFAHPEFDSFDLSAYRNKFCTSAPFSAALKAEVLARWPGGLTEYYGMTEGGGTCILKCHDHLDKLATVGQPAAGSDIRLVDDDGQIVPQGSIGEIVGRSPAMMKGYHNLPAETAAAEWFSPDGLRFIRTGDIGRFDEDGFLSIVDRKKDLVISGGFNIHPSDLEAALLADAAVREASVIAVPSERWGETPVAFVVPNGTANTADILAAANGRLGAYQRIAAVFVIDEMPRNDIGKILKHALVAIYRDRLAGSASPGRPAA